MNKTLLIITLCAAGILGWLLRGEIAPQICTETQVQRDTVYVAQPPDTVQIEKPVTIVERDTVIYVDRIRDTVFVEQGAEVASLDTILTAGRLQVDYYLPPLSFWDLRFYNSEQPVVTITETVTIQPPWYMDAKLWGATGLALGLLLRR